MKKTYSLIFALVILSGLLYFLQIEGIFSPYSFLDKFNSLTKNVYQLFSPTFSIPSTSPENEVLKSRIKTLEEENKNLRLLLQAPLPAKWGFIPANVIGFSRFLIVDKGEKDGVKTGNAVVYQDIFVGRIIEVFPSSAKVILPMDSEFKILVKTENNVRGLLVGKLGKEIFLEQVLQKETLRVGDKILTNDETLPVNILIGKVKSIALDEREPFKKAEIEPFFSYSALSLVFIVKP